MPQGKIGVISWIIKGTTWGAYDIVCKWEVIKWSQRILLFSHDAGIYKNLVCYLLLGLI